MNIVLGSVAPDDVDEDPTDKIRAHFRDHYGQEPVLDSEKRCLLGHLRSSGKIVGKAVRDGCTLIFNGCFFDPFPGLPAGAALDEPDNAANALLQRYLEHNTRFLDGLLGYYSLVVHDARTNAVHLAADPYGQRTFFYHRHDGRLAFSSNLAAILPLLERPQVDRRWEDFFLIYGFYPHGHTPFTDVKAAPAGVILTWRAGTCGEENILPYRPARSLQMHAGATLIEAIDVLYDAFMSALEQQCGHEPTAGVLLGGFDSALVASGLRCLGKKVSTWSFSYEDSQYNQPHAEDVARFIGGEHHWVPICRADLETGLEDFPGIFNQPTNWPNYVIQTVRVAQEMKRAGVTVAYSGDGCDTVFLGYPGTWQRAKVLARIPSTPEWATRWLTWIAARPLLERRVGHPYRVFLNLMRTASWPRHVRGFLSFRLLDEISLEQLRADERPTQTRDLRTTAEELARPFAALPALRLAYQGKSLVSPNKSKLNGSSDVSGIPILSPYMHPGFKQLAQSIPEELCRPNEATASRITGKYILMKMAENKRMLPPEVIYQKKVAAVDAPVDKWYAGPMRDFMNRKMAHLPFMPNPSYVDSLLAPHWAELLFQRYLLHDRIIKQAPSLLATYAGFCQLVQPPTPRSGRTNT